MFPLPLHSPHTHNLTCTVSSHSPTHYHIVTYMTLYSHCTTVLLYIVTNYASSVAQLIHMHSNAIMQTAECTCCDCGGPWFTTTLSQEVRDDIEVRMCSGLTVLNENIGVDELEIYIY